MISCTEWDIYRQFNEGIQTAPEPTIPVTPVIPYNYKTYVTSLTYAIPAVGGIAGADTICNSDPGKPVPANLFKALLVDETGCAGAPCRRASVTADTGDGQIDWVFKPNTTYYRADGITPIMTTNAAGLFMFGVLTNSWTVTASTGITGISGTWTTFATLTCTNYTVTTGSVTTAQFTQTASGSISGAGMSCTGSYNLLCIEQ